MQGYKGSLGLEKDGSGHPVKLMIQQRSLVSRELRMGKATGHHRVHLSIEHMNFDDTWNKL